eukprot:7032938-Alexandrium_andersonii.AAC.1
MGRALPKGARRTWGGRGSSLGERAASAPTKCRMAWGAAARHRAAQSDRSDACRQCGGGGRHDGGGAQ